MNKTQIKYISMIAIVSIFLVIVSIQYFKRNKEEERFENQHFYQYLSGNRFDYSGDLKIINNNEITEIVFKEVKIQLDSTPLYYKDEEKVIFPKNMSVIYPLSNGLQYKINYFARLSIEDDTIYALDGSLKKSLSNCFIYDGNDLYFFIEDIALSVKGKEYKLSKMSYVILQYNDNIQIYNKETDTYELIEIGDEEIYAYTDKYKINISIDAINYNGKSRLLIKKIERLNNLI